MFTGFGGRGDLREGYQFEDLCIDKKRVGKWIFERQNCRLWGHGQVTDCLKRICEKSI